MEQEKIERINQLARKKRDQGLTSEEAEEQETLRREYREQFRRNLRAQLDNLVVIDEDGNRLSVKEANKKRKEQGAKHERHI